MGSRATVTSRVPTPAPYGGRSTPQIARDALARPSISPRQNDASRCPRTPGPGLHTAGRIEQANAYVARTDPTICRVPPGQRLDSVGTLRGQSTLTLLASDNSAESEVRTFTPALDEESKTRDTNVKLRTWCRSSTFTRLPSGASHWAPIAQDFTALRSSNNHLARGADLRPVVNLDLDVGGCDATCKPVQVSSGLNRSGRHAPWTLPRPPTGATSTCTSYRGATAFRVSDLFVCTRRVC